MLGKSIIILGALVLACGCGDSKSSAQSDAKRLSACITDLKGRPIRGSEAALKRGVPPILYDRSTAKVDCTGAQRDGRLNAAGKIRGFKYFERPTESKATPLNTCGTGTDTSGNPAATSGSSGSVPADACPP